MSAFGGKADMTLCGNPLSQSLSGVKRTSLFAPHMSAFEGKADIIGDVAAPMQIATAADRQATVGPRFEYIYVKSV
jgi:hypothetical protein